MTRGVRLLVQRLTLVAMLCAAPFARQQVHAASFTPLGDLPGGFFYSQPSAISADGSVVVGNSVSAAGNEAFRWKDGVMTGLGYLPGGTQSYSSGVSADGSVVVGHSIFASGGEAFLWKAGVMTGLGVLPGGDFSYPYAVSADGSVAVGYSASASGTQAFRWKDGVMTALGILPGGTHSFAQAVSVDGSVVVGSGDSASGDEAFRWTSGAGMTGLGILPGGTYSQPFAISADGSVVVGVSDSASGTQAFRWKDGVMTGLGYLPGGTFSVAQAVSVDGSVVVGLGDSASGVEAFRWTSGAGMVGLGYLPGGSQSAVDAISADGSVVVGYSDSAAGPDAYVWDPAHGMRSIKDVLTAQGLDLTGWTLMQASGVSADGTVVVGPGTNPTGDTEAWRADLTVSQPPKSKRAVVLNGFGCVLPAGDWSGDIDLTSTKSHEVITSSGFTQLDCSFDIPKGLEPDKAIKIEGFTCNIIDKNGNVVGTTTDSRSVSTPGGKVILTCFIRSAKNEKKK